MNSLFRCSCETLRGCGFEIYSVVSHDATLDAFSALVCAPAACYVASLHQLFNRHAASFLVLLAITLSPIVDALPDRITVFLHGNHIAVSLDASLTNLNMFCLCTACLLQESYSAIVTGCVVTRFPNDCK